MVSDCGEVEEYFPGDKSVLYLEKCGLHGCMHFQNSSNCTLKIMHFAMSVREMENKYQTLVGKFALHSGWVTNSQTTFCVLSLSKSINILWIRGTSFSIIGDTSYKYGRKTDKTVPCSVYFSWSYHFDSCIYGDIVMSIGRVEDQDIKAA